MRVGGGGKRLKTFGSFPGASWSRILSELLRNPSADLQLAPSSSLHPPPPLKAREVIALIPGPLPTIHPASPAGTVTHRLLRLAARPVATVCKDPCEFLRQRRDSVPCPALWGTASELGSTSVPPLSSSGGQGHGLLPTLASPQRVFLPCLGGMSLRPADEQTEAERSPKKVSEKTVEVGDS